MNSNCVSLLTLFVSIFLLVDITESKVCYGNEIDLFNPRKIPPDETSNIEADCVAFDGKNVSHGLIYIPGPNMCSMCVCYHSEPMWCKTIYCPGPPWKKCARWVNGVACCEFYCLEERVNVAARSCLPPSLLQLLAVLAYKLL